MQVEAEREKDQDMHEKFECYCTKNVEALQKSIAELNDSIPRIEAAIKEAESSGSGVAAELEQHKQDRADAKDAIEKATAQRESEASAFAKLSGDLKANIAACSKAIDAITKGMAGSFLQSAAASSLRKLVLSSSLGRFDRETLTAFLSTREGYAPGSGEIVGILKQLLENMEGDLKEATDAENAAIAEFEGLVAAKKKEIAAATEAIEAKTERAGELAVKVVNLKNDLSDANDELADDSKYLAELKKQCADSGSEYEKRQEMRSQELVAIAETIKILNDDDALDLFKKTLASPSLLQVVKSDQQVRDDALAELQSVKGPKHAQTGFIQLALLGKKVGFEKIIKMIDDMVVTLGKEQDDDDTQRDWCNKEFDVSEDKQKDLNRKTKSLQTQIEEAEAGIATLKDELAALEQGIKELDAAVADATATRKAEHADVTETQAQNNAALQLLEVAKNRLNKFYNPKLYKAPPKRELTEEERLYVASGGVLTTPAPGGIAGTGIAVFAQVRATMKDAPAPPPETVDAYRKSDSSGPIALIDRLKNDLEKDTQAIEMEEKQAQKDYEELMSESATKRATDAKTIVEKETQKADAEERVAKAVKDHKASQKELMALVEYIAGLHASCDFLVQNYDLRKEARASEIESIQKAKAVLNGADYSFMQVESKTRFLHSEQAHKCEQDAQRRVQLLQSLTVLASDYHEACSAMGKDCPKVEVPKEASWGELDDLFDALALAGKKVF